MTSKEHKKTQISWPLTDKKTGRPRSKYTRFIDRHLMQMFYHRRDDGTVKFHWIVAIFLGLIDLVIVDITLRRLIFYYGYNDAFHIIAGLMIILFFTHLSLRLVYWKKHNFQLPYNPDTPFADKPYTSGKRKAGERYQKWGSQFTPRTTPTAGTIGVSDRFQGYTDRKPQPHDFANQQFTDFIRDHGLTEADLAAVGEHYMHTHNF